MSKEKPIIILFGAGASYGAGGIIPETPPLGFQLYEELERIYPNTWGSFPEEYKIEFRKNFEDGMGLIYENYGGAISQLMRELAVYFVQFRPHSSKSLYSKLITYLVEIDKINDVLFSTLNYECVFEYSVLNQGLKISYFDKYKDTVPIWKLHGSCNMFSQGLQAGPGVKYGTGVVFEGGIEAYLDSNKVVEECLVKSGLAPVMCLFMEGKPLQVSPSAIKQLQERWSKEVLNAEKIFCIGANPLPEDSHIWNPLSKTQANFFYIGEEKRFQEWASSNREGPYEYLSSYFHTGFIKLKNKLKDL